MAVSSTAATRLANVSIRSCWLRALNPSPLRAFCSTMEYPMTQMMSMAW